jgi:4-hydroxy-tetrahydrodipicolinate reductase
MKIALVGYGRMGRATERAALEMGHTVVARLARGDAISPGSLGGADTAVEFSTPDSAPGNLIALAEAGLDVACGTTGWDADLDRVRTAVVAAGTGLLVAPNFSPGVALFTRLVRQAAALAVGVPEYDVHLYEAHHRHKVDHPSGTARVLAETVIAALGRKHRWVESPPAGAPDPSVLYVSVARAGEIPGTHTVMLEGPHDRIELRHEARDRGGFARGAIEGAGWVHRRPGVHTLDDWMDDRFGGPPVDP